MVNNSERSIVLVVNDDAWIRLLMRDLLTEEGYAVLEAWNGLTELTPTRATADVLIIAITARTDLLSRAAELADALVANRSTLRSCWPKISVVCERSSLRTNGMQFIASGVDLPTRYKPGRSAGADHCRATLTLPEHRAGFGNDPEGV